MPAAARVVLVPPEAWSEDRLLGAARALKPAPQPLHAGDEVQGLVVVRVEPHPGAAPDARTVFDVETAPRPSRGPLQVAVLVDASASMATPWDRDRNRLEAARDALLAHLRGNGQPHASITLFAYARVAKHLAGPFAPSALAKGSIDLPEPAGPARPADALDAVLAHLAAHPHEGPQAIVLLTDGAGQIPQLQQAAARAGRLGIAVHVLAMAPEMDPALADLAKRTGGSAEVAALPLTFEISRRIHP